MFCCSFAQWCPTLCDPMDYSRLGIPVLHHHPQLTQIHVHRVGDAIQPSHPLSSSSLLPSNFPSIRVFSNELALHIVAKVLELHCQHQSFQWIFRVDSVLDGLDWSPCCPRASQEASPTPQFKTINSLVFSLFCCPALTSTYSYWKSHSFDCTDLCRQSNISAF